jgi:ABC-type sugar transport system ATPase subunit
VIAARTNGDVVPLLEIAGATKLFGAVTALHDVGLSLRQGQVLALLGDNGAGKSTLIKCLSGVHQLDVGTIRLDGAEVRPQSPQEARRLGIETVYQDLALFDNLTVAGNFFAGREESQPPWLGDFAFLRRRQMQRHAREALLDLEVGIKDPTQLVGLMSGGQRQAVAVARAAAFASRVMILDEPTAALGVRESRNVLRLVRRLGARGISVILISHNLDQVIDVADYAVILRGGRKVGEGVPSRENHEQMVSLIVGGKQESSEPLTF